ncbi:GntR family transcriptional regulator [Cognatishimia sp. SS12]|uniref:GntR family transcriptional regulator n=1 Tax=Cognatishimia sp. SS12 TaxID=2979465 RepID=UPI00232D656D|nr:GntR family transcriptional regulator [Cognatishimia sp. SS12]MDC0736928.1 GntR family transcriptional regulator [Cognatishimia sp. SS12]
MAKTSQDNISIYDRLLADIGTGVFPGGTRLKVQDLADRYGTSIIPVREALRLLQGEGVVTIAQNKGATVARFDANALRDIFEVLKLIEPYFVQSFAHECSQKDLEALQAIQTEIEATAYDARAKLSDLDLQFHAIIGRQHYNRRAFSIWHLQRRILNALALRLPASQARHAEVITEHQTLIAAFQARDQQAALTCIHDHIAGSGRQISQTLETV